MNNLARPINRKGMAGTAVSDIMAATGLTKGGIYGNRQIREDICREAYHYLVSELATMLDKATHHGRTRQGKTLQLPGGL